MSELFSFIRKQEDGSFMMAIPVSPGAIAPFIDASVDTGEQSLGSVCLLLNA